MSELNFLHVVGGAHIGYGRMGVYLAKEMRARGITVYDAIQDSPDDPSDAVKKLELYGERQPGISNVICWASVPTHARGWWEGQVPMILTMWEADRLPESFRENLHEFDTVMVPSLQNLELFSDFHPNVHYVPLGVDPERWHFRPRKQPTTRFNFLISGSGARKGTDIAVRAFREAFPEGSWGDGPVPHLVMKQLKPQDFYGPRIERVTGLLSGEEEADLYGDMHCYVQPSRGEGFGLQPLQAIAQGLPTILTDAHGHEAFAGLGMGINARKVDSGYFIYGDAGSWWEPDYDEIVDSMRWVYHNYTEATRRAYISSQEALTSWTWAATTNTFMRVIGEDRMTPYKGPKVWHTPQQKLYRVVTNCDHTADMGGTVVFFEKGQESYHPADVKRILFDAGKLDISCCTEDDPGILPEQLEKLPHMIQRANYCPTCKQKYGSGVTMSDEIMSGELDPDQIAIRGALA